MSEQMIVSSSPHMRDSATTRRLMLDVVIALAPAVAAGAWFFGLRALLVVAVTTAACVLAEYGIRRAMKRSNTAGDLSAVVTGMLLGMNLPPTIPLWIAVVGSFIAIVAIKQLFGGLGQNFMNPALGARVILVVAWGQAMTAWIAPGTDAVSAATPLMALKEGGALPAYLDLFLGRVGGCIGETSALAILVGLAYLLIRRVVSWEIPVIFCATVAGLTWALGPAGAFTGDPLFHLLSGGLLLGAAFMATDYVTSPTTRRGRLIFAAGCGLLTALFRLYTSMPEGVSFAIVLMNIATPLIDRYTVPKTFGGAAHV